MGEGEAGMNGAMEPPRPGAPADQAATDGGERTEQTLEQEIASLREELGDLVGELDRRRHEAFDLRLQVRRHATLLLVLGTVTVGLAVGGYVMLGYARRRRAHPLVRTQAFAHALALISRNPERLVRVMEDTRDPRAAALAALAKAAGAAAPRAIAATAAAPGR
jgi:hypothetical protein